MQARAGALETLLTALDCASSRICALAERAVVRGLDGGCFAPIGAYAQLDGSRLRVRGLYAADGEIRHAEVCGPAAEAEALGAEAAARLLRQEKGVQVW